MHSPLSQKQIDSIWNTLTLEQQDWTNEYTNQRRRDKWFEALAQKKGIVIDDQITEEEKRNVIDDWELVEILDGGKGNKPYKCECGKALRFQYIVFHASKNKTYKLGSTCIEHYTGLSVDVVKDIEKGILQINSKRDEILLKIHEKQYTNVERYLNKGIELPESITQQLEMGIPLLDDQIKDLEDSLKEIERQEWLETNNKLGKINEKQYSQIEYVKEIDRKKETFQYTYESFINENLDILKQIREKEERLSPKLKEEWKWMQNEVLRLKNDGTMDFETFFVRMENMLIPLKVTR
ncbi:hypothetical protein LGQ02_09785 [Bacillus shivajii]|uniref:hypothetical protein n=1 Tax=Bacillus shivajii TaxID=1983719 RepID=UPI001CFA256E|nr:hypothetical protein [Bacillus shivajii]UCZ54985.1 hypothetical protein LGQ02_09785 [Bacillus shivajii]